MVSLSLKPFSLLLKKLMLVNNLNLKVKRNKKQTKLKKDKMHRKNNNIKKN
jgi:hypothetical protein